MKSIHPFLVVSILLNTVCSKKEHFKVKHIAYTTLDAAWDSSGEGITSMGSKRLKNFEIARQCRVRNANIDALMRGYVFLVLTK